MKNEVKAWLESFDYEGVEPVTVTIGKQSWDGARYIQEGQPRIYLLGKLPEGWKNSLDPYTPTAKNGCMMFSVTYRITMAWKIDSRSTTPSVTISY